MRYCILLTIGILVAGCGGGAVVLTRQAVSPAYTSGEFAYAAAGRDLRVAIVGNPFDGDRAAFERSVTDAMQGEHWGQRTRFTVDPGADARDIYRVVMLFNPAANLPGHTLCRTEPDTPGPDTDTEGRLGVYAAFCRSDKLLTRVRGTIEGAAGPDDPLFRDLIGQVTNALFPLRQRHDDEDRCGRLMLC